MGIGIADGGYLRVCLVVVTVAASGGFFLAACDRGRPHVDYAASFRLEVANVGADRVNVRIGMGVSVFAVKDRGPDGPASLSDIVALDGGERKVFRVTSPFGTRDSAEDGAVVSTFREIHFQRQHGDTPYRSYVYRLGGCHERSDGSCFDKSGDVTLIYYRREDGVKERLFVESPERPFYLERDTEDRDLGRIVITFAPTVAGGGEDAAGAERADGRDGERRAE